MGIVLIAALAFVVSLLETVSYVGLIRNHLHIPSFFVYLLSILAIFLFKNPQNKLNKIINKLLLINVWFSSLTYLSLNLVESFTYQNYVLSQIHVSLKGLNYFTFLSLVFFFLFRQPQKKLAKLAQALLLASLIFFSIRNIATILPEITKASQVILAAPTASFDQKMKNAFPDFYLGVKMVASLTPTDATIIIPPQQIPWVSEGNDAYIQSFLYPRKIIHLPKGNQIPSGNVYMVIAKGTWPASDPSLHGWPKIPVLATKIWRFDLANQSLESFNRNYDPQVDTWDWGLIKVKHE